MYLCKVWFRAVLLKVLDHGPVQVREQAKSWLERKNKWIAVEFSYIKDIIMSSKVLFYTSRWMQCNLADGGREAAAAEDVLHIGYNNC